MMKKIGLLIICLICSQIHSQTIFGKWETIDDITGEAKSIFEIFEKDGKVYGKVIEIFNPKKRNEVCTKCEGEMKNKPILGMVLLRGLSKDDKEYNGGKITDPETGKTYKCIIKLVSKNKLEVRGYLGFSLIGRSQYWNRKN